MPALCREKLALYDPESREVYLGDRWYTLDARHNKPRIGRILMARGRDATDVAIATSFGPCTLVGFKVITDEVQSAAPASP
jgi:transglutaminase-like putative cysteine protease